MVQTLFHQEIWLLLEKFRIKAQNSNSFKLKQILWIIIHTLQSKSCTLKTDSEAKNQKWLSKLKELLKICIFNLLNNLHPVRMAYKLLFYKDNGNVL